MGTSPAPLRIGDRLVGSGQPAYLVAEIGINHNGDMGLARETIAAARDAGADAVKFQNYRSDDFVVTREALHTYTSNGRTVTESQYDMFRRYELDDPQLAALAEACAEVGVGFHSTPTNVEGVRLLARLGAPVLKNGSDYLTNLDLIRAMGESGLPVVLSTGMATAGEIDDAVRALRATGNEQLVLLHCVSLYPAPAENLNLRRIASLRDAFDCPVGFSDHSEGVVGAVLSVAFEACWIEKHFTLDRTLPGPDHAFSSDPAEFARLARAVREAEAALGNARIGPAPGEAEARKSFGLSCCAARNLPAGHVLTRDDIAFFRPGSGWPPAAARFLVGRGLREAMSRGQLLSEASLR